MRFAWAAVVALALAASAAHAQDEGGGGFLSRLRYCVSGGAMAGVGPQGTVLRRGPYAAFNVHGESTIGMQIGLEASYAASDDVLRTHFLSFGGLARLSPVPEDYRAFVQVSAFLSHVTFSPKVAGLDTPGTRTRPGGSFGVGFDAIETDHVAIGGLVTYNGVLVETHASRSYIVAALNVTFKPGFY